MSIKRTAADVQFSYAVRAAAGNTCERCGKTGSLECCHLVGRRDKAVRWDMTNAVSMCHYCHRTMTENPKAFVDWVEDRWPDRWDILNEKRRAIVKGNAATRAEVAAHYRAELKRLDADPNYHIVSWI